MAVILNIDTSTTVCSVALTADGQVLCQRVEFEGRNHAAVLSDFIKACLDRAKELGLRLDAVAVSIGPGSYTGLRIGLSEAKGLAYALQVPLIGIDTLQLLATGAIFAADIEEDAVLMPMIDARRMEVYTAAYTLALEPLLAPTPLILTDMSAEGAPFAADGAPVYFFGDGAEKAQEAMAQAFGDARYLPDIQPLAVNMMPLADMAWRDKRFIDVAYSEPQYLKSFYVTKPKSRL